ncbi:desulfoferrodoxin [Candidatus Sumerlaeota bacterium]|nr:desulfoferrodoxin [Candidatus Sumerlaeota bacterium]
MLREREIYKCPKCNILVEVLRGADAALECCGDPMTLLTENTVDAAQEKHVPVIEKIDGGFRVQVGSVAHPMEAAHYIEWIELIADGRSYRKFLKPGDKPEAEFSIDAHAVTAREHCNLHGLWKS